MLGVICFSFPFLCFDVESVTAGSNGYSKSAGGERKNRGVRSQEEAAAEVSANESGRLSFGGGPSAQLTHTHTKEIGSRHDVIRSWIDWTSTPTIHQR